MTGAEAAFPQILLNDLFDRAGIDPSEVVVVRHRPSEARLNKVMPWLVTERPDLFSAYQSIQDRRAAATFTRRRYLASFLGLAPGAAVLASLSQIGDVHRFTDEDYRRDPTQAELFNLGLTSTLASSSASRFNLSKITSWDPWAGRLVVDWPGKELSWFRLAERNVFRVRSISEESLFAKVMPHWSALDLSWTELQTLPASWKIRLAGWRGVYFIFDTLRKAGYVGSASGEENILSRWIEYGRTGHGGNVRLRSCDPLNLRFSILQLTSPDMPSSDVVALEASWKMRLHTKDHGLNAN